MLDLSPDAIGGSMALDARNFNRFIYRDLFVEYIPAVQVGFTTGGVQTFAFGYSADGALSNYASINFQSIQSAADSQTFNIWRPAGFHVKPLIDNLPYTEIDTVTTSGDRLTTQGSFMCTWPSNATATSTAPLGYFIIHYVMDLYDRSPDYGFTMVISDPTRRKEVLLLLEQYDPTLLSRRDRGRLLRLLKPKQISSLDVELLTLLPPDKEEKKVESKRNK